MQHIKLIDFIDIIQSKGRYCFTIDEALRTINISKIAIIRAIQRLSKKGRVVLVRRGFYVIVPPEYQSSGILPPSWFIHDLMQFIGQPYYVGLLSAAAIFGAAHQQPQVFHVVTNKSLRNINESGLSIQFFVKSNLNSPTVQIKTNTGFMPVSTPASTAIDLMRYENRIGGLERVVTILEELSEAIKSRELVEAAKFEKTISYVQRLGFLLDEIGKSNLTKGMTKFVKAHNPCVVPMDPKLPYKNFRRNLRWNVIENFKAEVEF